MGIASIGFQCAHVGILVNGFASTLPKNRPPFHLNCQDDSVEIAYAFVPIVGLTFS